MSVATAVRVSRPPRARRVGWGVVTVLSVLVGAYALAVVARPSPGWPGCPT